MRSRHVTLSIRSTFPPTSNLSYLTYLGILLYVYHPLPTPWKLQSNNGTPSPPGVGICPMTKSAESVESNLTALVRPANFLVMIVLSVCLLLYQKSIYILIKNVVLGKCGHSFHMVSVASQWLGTLVLIYVSTALWRGLTRSLPKGYVPCVDRVCFLDTVSYLPLMSTEFEWKQEDE